MPKVKLTVVESRCRCGCCRAGDTYIVEDICPPLCHELWHCAYPMVYALLCGGTLDVGTGKAGAFVLRCPDEGRVLLHGETIE